MALENLARNIRTSAAALALAATACTGGGGGGGGCSPTEPGCGGDTQKPSISWTAPNNNATIQGTVPLSVNANDNVGVTNVTFYNGQQQISSDNSAPYTAILNSSNLQNGNYTLRAVARDAAGNTNEASRAVTVNNPLARPNASDVTLAVQEDSAQNHDLTANVTGEQNGAVFSILNKPSDINASMNGSRLMYSGTEDVNGSRDLQYVVTNPDGQADTANINLTITPMTDYRFELREFFSKTPITDSWSTKINGETKNSNNGIVEGQVAPGTYNIELINHANTFPADRIEIGEDVRILFPKFNTDTLTFNNDFTATIYRPSKNDANFNEQTLPSWLAHYDNEHFGTRVPLTQSQRSYINTSSSSGAHRCDDMPADVLNAWKFFQVELQQLFGSHYTLSIEEGTAPPLQTVNGFLIAADNSQVLCYDPSVSSVGKYYGNLDELTSSMAHIPAANTGAAFKEAISYYMGAHESDTGLGNSTFERGSPLTTLTPFDHAALQILQKYSRPAGERRVQNGGETPFFSFRTP